MSLSTIISAIHIRPMLVGFALLFIFTLGSNSFGQNTSVVTVNVIDANGAKVSGAAVTLTNQLLPITIVTDDNGVAVFNNVGQGNLQVSVNATGFPSVIREIKESDKTATVEIILSPGGISENVTVTATRTQISTDGTAVPVSVIGREEIERRAVNTVGDIFRTLPGTSTVNEGAFQVRPRIRGLESNRILILVDGERLNNARTSTSQSGIEIGLVDIGQIETFEVVRGAGSVLYGTDALAGTVNIITRETPRRNDGGFRFGGQLSTYFSSNEKGRRGNLGLTGSSKFFAFRVAQSLERYQNYFSGKADGEVPADFLAANRGGISLDGEVGNSQSHGGNTQVTTRFFFNDDNDLRLNYERRRAANIGSPLLTLDYGFNAYFPYSDRDKFNGRFETRNLNKYLAKASTSFYYQKQKREFANQIIVLPYVNSLSETVTDTGSYGFDVQTNWLLGKRNYLTTGVSLFQDNNTDSRLSLNRLSGATTRTTSVPKADFGSIAFFAQDEFTLTNRLKLIGGIRVERFNSGSEQTEGFALPSGIRQFQLEDIGVADLATGLKVNETAFTGDFGAVFRVTDAVSLSGRVGRSFRVANLFERFFTGAGSVGGFLVGNPNLVPESGVNFDTAVKVRTSKFAGSFTYFNNNYRNFLSNTFAFDNRVAEPHPRCPVIIVVSSGPNQTRYEPSGPNRPAECIPSGGSFTRVQQTINFGKVRLQGFEAELEVPFRIGDYGFLTPNGNVSYLRGDNLKTDEMFNIAPPLKTVLNLRWNDIANRYYAEFQTRVVNKHERLTNSFMASNGGPEPGFATSDIRGGYSFRRERFSVSINAGITNLFNRFYNEQFILAPARGRSFTIGTTWEIK